MSLSALAITAAEEHSESINHWVVGGISLAILLAMIGALIVFGAGREHS
jgi:hypothetical protein